MIIKNIVKSETEPSTNCLWLKDNSLYHHNNGNWEPVDLNTVQGVEKLEEDVSEIQSSVQKIERDYIGVWDELNSVKEILASIQSGELPALLARLGYTEEDVDHFVEANLNMQLGVTLEDVKNSVELWENRDYYIHLGLSNNLSIANAVTKAIAGMSVLPAWTEELAKNGLYHEYTSELGTTTCRINTSEFFSDFNLYRKGGRYIPYLYLDNDNINSDFVVPIYFADTIYTTAGDGTAKYRLMHLRGVNNLIMKHSDGVFHPIGVNENLSERPTRLRNLFIQKDTESVFNADNLFNGHNAFNKRITVNIDSDKVFTAQKMLAGNNLYFPRMSGTFDFSPIVDAAMSVTPALYQAPLNKILGDNTLVNSTIYCKSSDKSLTTYDIDTVTRDFLTDTKLAFNNKIFIDYTHYDKGKTPTLQWILGTMLGDSNLPSIEDMGNDITLNNLEKLFIDTTDFKDRSPNITLFVPNLKYLNVRDHLPSGNVWLKEISNLNAEIDLDFLISDEFFTERRFIDCMHTWSTQVTPINLIMSTYQYSCLGPVTKSELVSKNFNIVVNE